jgi:glycosyltransferase involved in cell wall biosynthesis
VSANRRVSAIVIFRDESAFLEQAIQSVRAQTFSDWELLLVDDGSVDGSTELARRHAAAEPGRIRYLEHSGHENRGMSASRNLGVRNATGPYLAFLDGDDTWLPGALAAQVASLEGQPNAAMVYGPIRYWFSWTGEPMDEDRDYVEPTGYPPNVLLPPPGPLSRFLRDRAAVPSGILVRRQAALAIGGFEEAFRGEYEDQAFLAKLCLRFPVFAADGAWYLYRQHTGSAVATGLRTGATDAARLSFLRWLARYLRHSGRFQSGVWWACHVELWRFTRPRAFHLVRHAESWLARLQGRSRPGCPSRDA